MRPRSRRLGLPRPRRVARLLRSGTRAARTSEAGDVPGRAWRGDPLPALPTLRVARAAAGVWPEAEQRFELYAPGFHHVAFHVDRREDVDAAHEAAVAAGATVLHAPRLFPQYREDYYATFLLDPDGFRIEFATAPDMRT